MIQLISRSSHQLMSRKSVTICRNDFKIENPVWQRIVRKLYTKYDKEFYSYPAAKTNHHAFETGLAYHTATMVRLADAISEVYPQLNKSLLYAGIMLHDLAKVIELTGPDQTEYTVRGNLLGAYRSD